MLAGQDPNPVQDKHRPVARVVITTRAQKVAKSTKKGQEIRTAGRVRGPLAQKMCRYPQLSQMKRRIASRTALSMLTRGPKGRAKQKDQRLLHPQDTRGESKAVNLAVRPRMFGNSSWLVGNLGSLPGQVAGKHGVIDIDPPRPAKKCAAVLV